MQTVTGHWPWNKTGDLHVGFPNAHGIAKFHILCGFSYKKYIFEHPFFANLISIVSIRDTVLIEAIYGYILPDGIEVLRESIVIFQLWRFKTEFKTGKWRIKKNKV